MERKIFLVVDGHPAHKAKLVRHFVEQNAERLELFFLPAVLTRAQSGRIGLGSREDAGRKGNDPNQSRTRGAWSTGRSPLQKLPDIVAGFFRAPTCRYAAA